MDHLITTLATVDPTHKQLLIKAGILKASDIWLHAPSDLAKKLKVPVDEVQTIISAVCKAVAPKVHRLSDYTSNGPAYFTTGDATLDKAIGGGIRTGMITEICGESSSGKTQLTLQLALTAQLQQEQGGLGSGVAYFTTSTYLPVRRLTELSRAHPSLQTSNSKSLTDNVHSCSTTTIPALISALKNALPNLCKQAEHSAGTIKPIRVLIIDSLGSLFHSPDKTTTATLVERSKSLSEIGQILHGFASSHQAAVIVINQVTDIFQSLNEPSRRTTQSDPSDAEPELVYKEQAFWFSRIPVIDSYPAREATLGLVWANQINTRIILSRTRRRLRSSEEDHDLARKRRKGVDGGVLIGGLPFEAYFDQEDEVVDNGTLVRKLSVLFSNVCAPGSLEFVVVKEGVQMMDTKPTMQEIPLVPRVINALKVDQPTESKSEEPLPSSNFISARLTQPVVILPDGVPDPATDVLDEGAKATIVEEDFDLFDEEEWAGYGAALGNLEEQWDVPEPETPAGLPPEEGDEDEVVEGSDVEENFLQESMLELSQKARVLDIASE